MGGHDVGKGAERSLPVNDVEFPSADPPLLEIGKRKGGQKRGVKRGRSPGKDRDFMYLDARQLHGLYTPGKHVDLVPGRQLGTQGGHIVRDALRPPDARAEERDSHRYAAESRRSNCAGPTQEHAHDARLEVRQKMRLWPSLILGTVVGRS